MNVAKLGSCNIYIGSVCFGFSSQEAILQTQK